MSASVVWWAGEISETSPAEDRLVVRCHDRDTGRSVGRVAYFLHRGGCRQEVDKQLVEAFW